MRTFENLRFDQIGVEQPKEPNSTKRPRITRQYHKSVHDTLHHESEASQPTTSFTEQLATLTQKNTY